MTYYFRKNVTYMILGITINPDNMGSADIRKMAFPLICFLIVTFFTYKNVLASFEKKDIKNRWFTRLVAYCVFGTVVGIVISQILYALLSNHIWNTQIAIFAAFIGASIALYIFSKTISKKSIWWVIDIIITNFPPALGMMYFAFFSDGQITGSPTSVPWGIRYMDDPNGSITDAAGHITEVFTHPVNLYGAVLCFLILFALKKGESWLSRQEEKIGFQSGLVLLLLFGVQFILNFFIAPALRGDIFFFLSLYQWFYLSMMVFASVIIGFSMLGKFKTLNPENISIDEDTTI